MRCPRCHRRLTPEGSCVEHPAVRQAIAEPAGPPPEIPGYTVVRPLGRGGFCLGISRPLAHLWQRAGSRSRSRTAGPPRAWPAKPRSCARSVLPESRRISIAEKPPRAIPMWPWNMSAKIPWPGAWHRPASSPPWPAWRRSFRCSRRFVASSIEFTRRASRTAISSRKTYSLLGTSGSS